MNAKTHDLTPLARWERALVSGEYTQSKSYLRTPDGKYDVFGVAGDLMVRAGKARWLEPGKAPGPTGRFPGFALVVPGENPEVLHAPKGLLAWLGLKGYPRFDGIPISTLNDGGASFADLARLVGTLSPAGEP